MKYQLHIQDRHYSHWSFSDENNQETVPLLDETFHPVTYKLFHQDTFEIEKGIPVHIESQYNDSKLLTGVLLLSNGQTYGRTQNNRLFYKCIPHDHFLPEFLVPYDQQLGFSKALQNKYVLFTFKNWESKHPQGILKETLGNVNELPVFYEYILHSKQLHYSLNQMNKRLKVDLKEKPMNSQLETILETPAYTIRDKREQCYVYSIDPQGSTDLDDAFSCQQLEENPEHYRVCVYISNVFIWLEHLQLWPSLSQRVSTIYFPDKKRTMLPTLFSEDWFSLLEKKDRLAFTMELIVHENGTIVEDSLQFYCSLVNLKKNFAYDEPKLLKNKHYNKLENLTKKMDTTIQDSHDVVSFWMIKMNVLCAEQLASKQTGIFRSSSMKNTNIGQEFEKHNIDNNTKQMLTHWNNVSCNYTMFEEGNLNHSLMNQDHYVHITSPIRRLVDVLNQIAFYKSVLQYPVSASANQFYLHWTEHLVFLNDSMKSIRKVQNECNLLYTFYNHPDIQNEEIHGVLFHHTWKDGQHVYQTYLSKYNMMSTLKTTTELELFTPYLFRVFLFEDEHVSKRKIRIQIIVNE